MIPDELDITEGDLQDIREATADKTEELFDEYDVDYRPEIGDDVADMLIQECFEMVERTEWPPDTVLLPDTPQGYFDRLYTEQMNGELSAETNITMTTAQLSEKYPEAFEYNAKRLREQTDKAK